MGGLTDGAALALVVMVGVLAWLAGLYAGNRLGRAAAHTLLRQQTAIEVKHWADTRARDDMVAWTARHYVNTTVARAAAAEGASASLRMAQHQAALQLWHAVGRDADTPLDQRALTAMETADYLRAKGRTQ